MGQDGVVDIEAARRRRRAAHIEPAEQFAAWLGLHGTRTSGRSDAAHRSLDPNVYSVIMRYVDALATGDATAAARARRDAIGAVETRAGTGQMSELARAAREAVLDAHDHNSVIGIGVLAELAAESFLLDPENSDDKPRMFAIAAGALATAQVPGADAPARYRRATLMWHQSPDLSSRQLAVGLLRDALEDLETYDVELAADAHAQLAQAWSGLRPDRAAEHAIRAIELYNAQDEFGQAAVVRGELGSALAFAGRFDAAERELRDARDALLEAGNRAEASRVTLALASVMLETDRPSDARAVVYALWEQRALFDPITKTNTGSTCERLAYLARRTSEQLGDETNATAWREVEATIASGRGLLHPDDLRACDTTALVAYAYARDARGEFRASYGLWLEAALRYRRDLTPAGIATPTATATPAMPGRSRATEPGRFVTAALGRFRAAALAAGIPDPDVLVPPERHAIERPGRRR